MTAIRELILESLKDRLTAITGFPGLKVDRDVSFPEDDAALPALIVGDRGHDIISDDPAMTICRLSATVDGMVKSSTDGGQGTVVNALYAAVMKAVMGEPFFSPYVIDAREGGFEVVIDRTRGMPFAASFSLLLLIDYATRDNDPEIAAP